MKVSLPPDNGPERAENLLPLRLDKERKLSKDQSITYKLRTDPTSATSPIYELTVPYLLGDESVRQVLEWSIQMTSVMQGTNTTTPDAMCQLFSRTLKGEARAYYMHGWNSQHEQDWDAAKHRDKAAEINRQALLTPRTVPSEAELQAIADATVEPAYTDECHANGLRILFTRIMPYKVLSRVKRELRRHSRKPKDMSVVEYFTAINRINDSEIVHLPPFGTDQKLTPDEITEVLMYGLPNSWKNEMQRQGFDPLEKSRKEFLDFCQRLEDIPDFHPTAPKSKKTSVAKNGKKPRVSFDKSSEKKYCKMHGEGNHSTSECRTIKNQHGSQNKSWSRKAEDNKKKSAKELASFVRKAVREELNSISDKKRKSDSSDDEEAFAFLNDNNLSDFNYGALNDLSIHDDDAEFFDAKERPDDASEHSA